MGGADRRHAVRQRRRAARPRDREVRGRARDLPVAARQAARRCRADVEVWPGHLGGSMCGGPAMDMKISSTIGFERAHNPALAIDDEDEFVDARARRARPAAAELRERSSSSTAAPLLTDGVELLPLAPRQVEQKRADGALLVDVRTDQQFDDAHIAGAVCIPMLSAGFGSKLAWLADREQRDRVRRARRRGRPRARPARAGGRPAPARRLPARRHDELAPGEAPSRADRADAAGGAARATPSSCRSSTCASAPSGTRATSPARPSRPGTTSTRVPDGLDPARPIAVVCASGQRAAVAASLVLPRGARAT